MSGVEGILPAQRDRRLKLAVLASIGSKVFTAALQVLIMPMVMRALGPERYGVFIMVSTSLIWIASTSIGLGNSLVIAISKAVATDDKLYQSRAVSSAFYAVLTISIALILGLLLIYTQFGIQTLFGNQYGSYQTDIETGFWLVVGFMVTAIILDVFEGTQSGYQENYIINIAGMLGQAVSATSLIALLISRSQSIINVIVCLYVLSVIPRLVNAAIHICYARPYLLPRLRHCSYTTLCGLLATGVAFSLMAVSQFLRQECGILLVGRMLGPTVVATYGIIANIAILAFGIITMQLRPLLPAIADARARYDIEWIDRARVKLRTYIMGYAMLFGCGMMAMGSTVIRLWYGPQVVPGVQLQIAIGLAFILQAWEIYHHTMLFGLNCIWPTVVLYLSQNVLMLILAIPLITYIGSVGATLAMCISVVLLGFWILPVMLRRALHNARTSE